MAGHSKYANTKHRKSAQDNKKSKICTKLMREIVLSAHSGSTDPQLNNRLRIAIYNARKLGLGKDKIDAALKNISGNSEGKNYEEIFYEGYAGVGVAVIIHSLTDNRNRTASDLRCLLSKNGGSLSENGSVKFLFKNLGMIVYSDSPNFSDIFDIAISVGASDVKNDDGSIFFYTEKDLFTSVRDELCARFGDPIEARLAYIPINYIDLGEDKKSEIAYVIEELNESDDVQHVDTNVKW